MIVATVDHNITLLFFFILVMISINMTIMVKNVAIANHNVLKNYFLILVMISINMNIIVKNVAIANHNMSCSGSFLSLSNAYIKHIGPTAVARTIANASIAASRKFMDLD